jgi:hypothetical protein
LKLKKWNLLGRKRLKRASQKADLSTVMLKSGSLCGNRYGNVPRETEKKERMKVVVRGKRHEIRGMIYRDHILKNNVQDRKPENKIGVGGRSVRIGPQDI